MNKMQSAPAHFRTRQSQIFRLFKVGNDTANIRKEPSYRGNKNVLACEKYPLTCAAASNSIIHHEQYRGINIMTNQSM